MKKGVLRDFTKFTGKHLCQILFFNKVACLSRIRTEYGEILLISPYSVRMRERSATYLSVFSPNVGKAYNSIKKETLAEVFSYEFCEISKNTIS